jgi:hypothetical protein
MKIDRKLIDQLNALDDNTLASLIRELGKKTGADEKSTMRAAANVGMLRRRVSKMGYDEINKALSTIGDDKINEVISDLSRRGIIH